MRVTTVRSGAPRSQAAGCLVRLQLPPSPSTRARGGHTQGGKKVLVIAARAQSRERVRRAPRRLVPQRTTLCAARGCTAPVTPSRVRCRRTRSAGAWAPCFLRGITPRGVRRTSRGRGHAAGPRKRALATSHGGAGTALVVPRWPTHRRGAGCVWVAAAPCTGLQPALDVAPGVARRLRQPPGLPGPRASGPRLGVDLPGSGGPTSRLSPGRWVSLVHRGPSLSP